MILEKILLKGLTVLAWLFTLSASTFWADFCQADCNIDYNNVITSAPSYYGSNIFWTNEDIYLIKERITKSNMNIMRLFISPLYIENPNDNSDPNSVNWGGFNFDYKIPWSGKTISYSTIFETLKDLDLYIMVDIPYLSPWLSANSHQPNDIYSTYPPNNYDEYKEFVYAVLYYMINNVGISPEKIILEPFNEPDLGCGQDPSVPCFWKNHTMDDTVNTFLAAYNAAKSVSPDIGVVGMAEWNDGRYVRNFIDHHSGINYLDGITYHKYSSYYDISSLISMGTGLMEDYGLPVFVNEYGCRTWGSDGTNGALWHSYTLTHLWKNGIQPLQHPFSEFPGMGEPYESMGLFYDWNNNWQIKDSFWVYSNFFRFMRGTDILNADEDIQNLDVIAGKREGEINIVITNRDSIDREITIAIQNLPGNYNNITVYDNFQENHILDSFVISGNNFEYVMPSRSSITINISVSPTTSTTTTITPDSITVTSPEAGEDWGIGCIKTIKWSSSGVDGNVKIELVRPSECGRSWSTIPYANNTGNDGIHDWTVQGPAQNNCIIKITSIDNPNIYDESDLFDIVLPTITVISPLAGVDWEIGKTETVRWTSSGVDGNVKIELGRPSAYEHNWSTIPYANNTSNDGIHDWTVQDPAQDNCIIKITSIDNPDIYGESGSFEIVLPTITVISPLAGIDWEIGKTETVRWISSGVDGNVKIEIVRPSACGSSRSEITDANNRPNVDVKTFGWAVEGPAKNNCRIMITSVKHPNVYGESGLFDIVGTIIASSTIIQ